MHSPQVATIETPKLSTRPTKEALQKPNAPLYLDWPLNSVNITSFYGPRQDPVNGTTAFHKGVDISAPYGTIVRAPADGHVRRASWNHGHGRQLILQHTRGFQTVFSHLSAFLVINKQFVTRGQAIGYVGNSGKSTGAHLHLEVLHHGSHRDPLRYIGIRLYDD